MPKLTEEQKKKQRQELYNYRNILYPQLKKRSDRWRTRCKEAERENRELREGYGKAGKEIEKLRLQVEELQEIAYGKKRVSRQKKKNNTLYRSAGFRRRNGRASGEKQEETKAEDTR
jgi:predicted RNase H-like nuclease (RuvC/YqgF family)